MSVTALIFIGLILAGVWLASAIYVAIATTRLLRKKLSKNKALPLSMQLKRPIWKSLLLWTIGSFVWIPAALLTGTAALNYSGYCFKQRRYLTDEERLESAIEGVLATYSTITYAYDELPESGFEVVRDKSRCCGEGDMSRYDKSTGGVAISSERLIPYRDIKDFRALNPDCCSFDRVGFYGEVGSTGLWPKIAGYSAGFTNVKFKVRYRDARNEIKTKFSAESFNLTNCGRGAWPHQS
jgi:hypothetical protein